MKYLWRKSYVSWPLEALYDINVRSIPHNTKDTYWSIHLYEGFHSYLFACL